MSDASRSTRLRGSSLSKSVAGYIKRSRKKITVLFTDIEDSTRFWEKVGDVQGRLMVDLHNRLAFPVIHKFKGRIIKTIGDSIMASFKKPENAVKAAMGIQQILEQAREADSSFTLRVRIGIHTGLALVEDHDVFGDVVNVAARVESEAKGNEILVSEATMQEVEHIAFDLVHAGRFKPKGKSDLMSVYRCPWQEFESIIDGIKPGSYLPVVAKQKVAIAVYLLTCLATLYFIYVKYLRYVVADTRQIAVLTLNPRLIVEDYPIVLAGIGVVLVVFVITLARVQALSHLVLKLITAGFGLGVVFFVFYLAMTFIPFDILPAAKRSLYESTHLFVHVLEDDSAIRDEPSEEAKVIRRVDSGDILLQLDTAKRGGLVWNKVLLDFDEAGWIIRRSPPKMGVEEKRVTMADKFRFRLRDLVAFLLGAGGFVWGFFRFRIRPS